MSNVSLERYYFVLYDGALTLKMSKMALNAFCDKTLHMLLYTKFEGIPSNYKRLQLRSLKKNKKNLQVSSFFYFHIFTFKIIQ